MTPLRREWEAAKAKCDELWPKVQEAARKSTGPRRRVDSKERKAHDKVLQDFHDRLAHVTVLDPACGSGNFLYVAINLLLDLEKQVIAYAAQRDLTMLPQVRPTQLAGIEFNPYAQQLAQVVIWIGYLQWMHHNGFVGPRDPVLEPIENIHRMDAIIDLTSPGMPIEPEWPEAEFIVGNPPFLGASKLWEELGREYQQQLWELYKDRVPGFADLCCYWFEKARIQLEGGKAKRAGLLATQAIRGGASREVLNRIKESGDIFFAISDRDWVLEGANVHVSMVGFDAGSEQSRLLDNEPVGTINVNLTTNADITQANHLEPNAGIAFSGTKKSGLFNVGEDFAGPCLLLPNPHRKPNSDLLRPWLNGTAIARRPESQWIIDTGVDLTQEEFALYEKPFQHARLMVKPERDKNKRGHRRDYWWLHAETCPGMRKALRSLARFISTPRVSKHRLFMWTDPVVLGDDGIYVFAREDDYFFGILHSRLHEVWALAQGTQVRERESGFRYPHHLLRNLPVSFPSPTPEQKAVIAAAAKELDQLRTTG